MVFVCLFLKIFQAVKRFRAFLYFIKQNQCFPRNNLLTINLGFRSVLAFHSTNLSNAIRSIRLHSPFLNMNMPLFTRNIKHSNYIFTYFYYYFFTFYIFYCCFSIFFVDIIMQLPVKRLCNYIKWKLVKYNLVIYDLLNYIWLRISFTGGGVWKSYSSILFNLVCLSVNINEKLSLFFRLSFPLITWHYLLLFPYPFCI